MTISIHANSQTVLDAEMRLPDVASAPSLTKHNRPALPALTGLRFFAAMYVVVHHTGLEYAKRHHASVLITTFLGHGVASVALFFVLSGFILSYTYQGQIRGRSQKFLEARFARIYPVYLLSLVLSLGMAVHLGVARKVAVLAMVQAWLPGHPELATAWNYPAWTLSAEVAFYLLFPAFMFLFEYRSRRTIWIALFFIVAFSALTESVAHQPGIEGSWSPLALMTPYPLLRLPEFFVGVLLGLLYLKSKEMRYSYPTLLASLAVLFALLLIPGIPELALTIIPFAFLVYSLAHDQSWIKRGLSTELMLFLGGASYSVYLFQVPVRNLTRVVFQHLPSPFSGFDFLASPVILILLSCIIFRFYEEPSRQWIRSVFAKNAA